jgi:hypothetical protein
MQGVYLPCMGLLETSSCDQVTWKGIKSVIEVGLVLEPEEVTQR